MPFRRAINKRSDEAELLGKLSSELLKMKDDLASIHMLIKAYNSDSGADYISQNNIAQPFEKSL